MPTLGPFFRYLRPSRLKHVAKGHKTLGDEADEVWSKPGTLDHSLMYGSMLVSQQRETEEPFDTAMHSTTGEIRESTRVKSMQEPYISGENDIEINVSRTR